MNREKAPLFRKENKVSLSCKYYVRKGGDFRHERNTKVFLRNDQSHAPMHSGQFGYDYTPLFKFLLSKVGKKWDQVFSEAVARLDKQDPIFWLVALSENDKKDIVRSNESSYYSGLYVDDEGLLQKVSPNAKLTIQPAWFETISFNGKAI